MQQFEDRPITLAELITNLLGLSNYQPQPDIPPMLSQQLVDRERDDQRRKRALKWSDRARRIMRGEASAFPAPNYSPNPGQPGWMVPIETEEGGAELLQPGRWADRDSEIDLDLIPKQKGKRRKPGTK